MLITCTTKGCLRQTDAKLDIQSNEVICEECGNPISNITPFTKKALKSCGQILRGKNKEPFQALCQTCNAMRSLYVEEGKAFCKVCNTQVHITAAFKKGLEEYLKGKKKEEQE